MTLFTDMPPWEAPSSGQSVQGWHCACGGGSGARKAGGAGRGPVVDWTLGRTATHRQPQQT